MDVFKLIKAGNEIAWSEVVNFPLNTLKLESGEPLESRYPEGKFDNEYVSNEITVRKEDNAYMFYHFVFNNEHGDTVYDETQELTQDQLFSLIGSMKDNRYKMMWCPYDDPSE